MRSSACRCTNHSLGRGRLGRGGTRGIFVSAAVLLVALAGASCGGSSSSTNAEPSPTAAPSNTVWLCRPGLANNPCETDLTAQVVSADGGSTTEGAAAAADPPIDCFYVYPTVSNQKTPNANLQIDPEETSVAIQQASRFSQVCKVYAPMYRQRTLSALVNQVDSPEIRAIAYGDVLSAWQDYMAHYNNGRGFVLIGHSQGARMLTQLVASEIDSNPELRGQLVSALIIGGNVTVAAGQDVGGDFQNVPACRNVDQTGCVVAYSTFDQTPPADSHFGKVGAGLRAGEPTKENQEVLCANPASLSGGGGPLKTYFYVVATIPARWVAFLDLYTGRCESSGGVNWLQVDTTKIAGDKRPTVSQTLGPKWGLHLYDVNLALGNLVDLVRQQAAAYLE